MMHAIHDVPAPAKLNLFLHITGRRPDGYHLLQSAFMLIDWCDTLHFEHRASGALSREDLTVALPPDDLVLRAARALQHATGTPHGAHIAVDKRIPSQAGMGGGSSDAATCLLVLNRLWGCALPLDALERIGLSLGADVPFFLRGHNAWVEGIGESIQPLTGPNSLPPACFLVVKPSAGLPTASLFSAPDLPRETLTARISGFAAHPYGFGRNDLQSVATRLCPEVSDALKWLSDLGLEARMTGSGSAVFAQVPPGFVPGSPPADRPGWQIRLCSNLDKHPLAGWASSGQSDSGSLP